MRADGLPDIDLLIAHPTGEARALGKEPHLLDNPERAVRVPFALTDDASLGIPLLDGDRDGLSRRASCTDQIPCLRLGLRLGERALQVLAP